jgi:predicted ribosome quality control (RQC) complex YloA/Tae2 family protein
MQNCYKKYDKLKRAQELLRVQRQECEANITYLESIEASLLASASLAEIAEIHNELVESGYLREKLKRRNNDKPSHPFHFETPDGLTILVGKNNYQNDKLTFKTASFNDTWFHTKDIPGSHVILRNAGAELTEDNILLAANLAAHFSKSQGSSKIPVDYTEIRYVKKPSGSKPGFVIFTNQKTLYVTPDETALKQILAHEC